jgi:D-tyrosyl-tRNA(Tyr) deacylase
MRAVVQRVAAASVEIDGRIVGRIDAGLLVLLGVQVGDTAEDVAWMVRKLAGLRIFRDPEGRMNLDVASAGGGVLLVSQFTLLGDCRRGHRPSFVEAAPPEIASPMVDATAASLRDRGLVVETGRFGADMLVRLENDGPVTIVLDSRADGGRGMPRTREA